MESEYDLIHTMKDLAQMKEEYVKVQSAIDSVRGTGYGVVIPELEEIEIEEPAVIRQGNKFGVKIKSKSPSIHMIKANIETEIAPIVGTEQQAKDLIQYIGESGERGESILGDKYFWKIHSAACSGRHPYKDHFHRRRKSGEASGYYAENCKRQ